MANNANQTGMFIPTTNIWDTSSLEAVKFPNPEMKELFVRLYQNLNLTSSTLNLRDAGYYPITEFVNGQLYFPNPAYNSSTATTPTYRQVYRKVINFGALPNTGTKSVAHGITITSSVTFTRIYATATQPSTSFIPIPYASPTLANNIELNVDATNVNITTGSNRSAYTVTYVVLEWIKQ
jgi:hypothetical protein